MSKRIILGDGLLGSTLHKLTGWDIVSRKKDGIDITKIESIVQYTKVYDEIINCIGFTSTYSNDKKTHWEVNYKGVYDLACQCSGRCKLVHISTDYIYSNSDSNVSEDEVPVHCKNWYGYTKLLGDGVIQLFHNYLLIRTSFKSNPFLHDKALIQQVGNFDYVDKIGSLIVQLIEKQAEGVYNVGTEIKTIYDLAKRTKEDVHPMLGKLHETMPTDITMDCSKMEKFLYE